MPEPWQQEGASVAPQQAVGRAIQDLVAARLGRGFVPLALLVMTGLGQLIAAGPDSPGGLMLVVGAASAGGAMLAYGLRVVQLAFGRRHHLWMSFAMLGSILPPLFALYVLGWRGLRMLVPGGGVAGLAWAVVFTGMGVWVMRAWMKVVEVERLARVMAMDLAERGGTA